MRIVRLALALFIAIPLIAQQRGVYVEDIDRNANACDNFFDYANGAWRAAHTIPKEMDRWSRRWAAGEQNKEQLRTILNEETKKTWKKGSIDQQISDFYRSCMDEAKINAAGIKPIQPLLADIEKMQTRDDLQAMIARLQDLEIAAPWGIAQSPDNHEPTQTIGYIFARGIGLPDRDYYFKEDKRFVETRAKYLEHLAKMFQLMGDSKAVATQNADTVYAMEKRLAAAHLENAARRNPNNTDHKMSVAELQKLTPHFDWTRFFESAHIPNADLNVSQPKFMTAADAEIANTSIDAWKTYLRWHLINFAAPYLSDKFSKPDYDFYGAYLAGTKERKPRWKRCIETEDNLLGEALGQRYVERYFPPAAKARMVEMVKNLLAAMGDTIKGLDWMGADTKQKALEKLSTFNPKVGYPDKWKDYSSVSISPNAYWQNVVAGYKYDVEDNRAQIGKPTDRGRWGMTPPTSNAYYNPSLNEIVFPAGILQPPAFDNKAVDAINYGAIGVVIGHEISHGFDDQGAKYDAQGRLQNWWTDEDLKRFGERTSCVSNQFENYFIEPGIHHNGKLVLGESIGDLAGARIAYLAFQKAQQKTPAPTLDGFTPDQQFFIAWGQFRGDEIRPETQRLMVQGDPHPIAKYRVVGPLSNLPEFAKAFGCKMKEPHCEVW
jgi:putative endopeptidase